MPTPKSIALRLAALAIYSQRLKVEQLDALPEVLRELAHLEAEIRARARDAETNRRDARAAAQSPSTG